MIVMAEHNGTGAGADLDARLQRLIAVFELALDELRHLVAVHAELAQGDGPSGPAGRQPEATSPDVLPYPDNVAPVSHLGRGLGSLVVADADRDGTDHGLGPAAHHA